MSTTVSNPLPFDRHEPIPGYRTEELLGRGGYGEVWRAIAPGGIAKAVKIVYGNASAANAETEMRALSRIKDVRHPLLLSIERIEVTHGNLVIVTELADRSLADHFARLRQAKSIGIPQEELLKFVSDAAEVLDYLYESYSLQHLDVKPENILIVGGRAKLGDFGLVKNLYERGGSQVGGLTPTYAPPELFEGRPTRQSDQYSLAIVYVHMLTGALPFQAHSTAEIATQHLRGVPDLAALPRSQRPIIARALSKDPSLRFASCTAMVAALKDAAHKSDQNPATAHSGFSGSAGGAHHLKPTPTKAAAQTCDGCYDTIADLADAAAGSDPDGERAGHCPPTILVGIGGAGIEILGGLVERLHDRFGNAEDWPAVEFLVLDSNTRSVSSRFKEVDLAHVEVVPMPLKPAEAYGSQASNFVRWLGRRWFYNIPRDLTTGGYRPLGRLALLTNAQRVREGIATVVSRSVSNADARSGRPAGTRGARNQAAPRVIVVGSIGGGTGSGAILDVAYAVRSELKKRGLSDEQVHGVLLHAEPRSNAERDKARTNAYATLNELFHFSCPGSHYPGEPLLDVPPFHGDNATFAGTHLLFLGDSQGEAEWRSATNQVAEFLYGIAFTPAARILDPQPAASHENHGNADGQSQLRTYQVLSLGASGSPTVTEAIRLARNDVLHLWRQGAPTTAEGGASSRNGSLGSSPLPGSAKSGSSSSAPLGDRTAILNSFSSASQSGRAETDLASIIKQQFSQLSLDLGDFLADAAEVIRLEIGDGAEQFVSKLVDDCLSTTADQPAGTERTSVILAMIDRYLQADFEEGHEGPADDQLFTQMTGRLAVRARGRINSLLDWIRNSVNAADVRIEGARRRAVAAQQLLQSLHENALTQAAELHKRVIELGLTAKSDEIHSSERKGFFGISLRRSRPDDKVRECLNSYAKTSLDELLHRAVAKVARIVVAEVSTLIEQLDRLSRDLNRMAGSQQPLSPSAQSALAESDEDLSDGSAPELAAYRRLLREQLRIRRHEIARQIDECLEQQLSNAGQSLRTFLDSEYELQRLLGKPLEEAARQAVLAFIQEINAQLIRACGGESECQAMRDLGAMISASLVPAHGDQRPNAASRVLIVPDEADTTALRTRLGRNAQATTIVEGRKSDITLCSIRRDATLESAANEIIDGVAIYKELANRLHTRVDLVWRPFGRVGTSADVLQQGTQESTGPTQTVVLPQPSGEGALPQAGTLACAEVVPGAY